MFWLLELQRYWLDAWHRTACEMFDDYIDHHETAMRVYQKHRRQWNDEDILKYYERQMSRGTDEA